MDLVDIFKVVFVTFLPSFSSLFISLPAIVIYHPSLALET